MPPVRTTHWIWNVICLGSRTGSSSTFLPKNKNNTKKPKTKQKTLTAAAQDHFLNSLYVCGIHSQFLFTTLLTENTLMEPHVCEVKATEQDRTLFSIVSTTVYKIACFPSSSPCFYLSSSLSWHHPSSNRLIRNCLTETYPSNQPANQINKLGG